MAEPDLLQRQREILRAFRQATARRTQAEADAEACRKADREAADAVLNKVQQEAETQQTKAEAHRKADHTAADAALSQARQAATAQLAEARKAQEKAQAVLTQASLQGLLEQTKLTSTTSRLGANPAGELAQSASVATEALTSIQADIEALQRWREEEEKRGDLYGLFVFVALVFLAIIGYILVSELYH